jgi:hypothetical protein
VVGATNATLWILGMDSFSWQTTYGGSDVVDENLPDGLSPPLEL